jgi:hypothetical protein
MGLRKVAIVGTHPSASDVQIPEGYEVWVINNGWSQRPSFDRLYELHRLEERPWRSEEHKARLRRSRKKVWTLFPGQVKGANLLPVMELLEKGPSYFTNSVAWMIAHALHEGVTHLYILGVHFLTPRERLLERACAEFWIGYAKGRGVEVTIPAASSLLKGRGLYGLEDSLHNSYVELNSMAYQMHQEDAVAAFSRSGFYEESWD